MRETQRVRERTSNARTEIRSDRTDTETLIAERGSIRVRTRPLVSNYTLKAGVSAFDEPVVVAHECASDKDGTTVVGAP